MATCISCKKESQIHFRALEVHTLPVRDLGGEKKVQALGEFKDFDVCRDCALKKQDAVMHYQKTVRGKLAVYAGIVLVGAILMALILTGHLNRVFMTMGIACVLGGVLMAAGTLQSGRDKKAEYEKLGSKGALLEAAWDCVVDHAPRKYKDNDVTYIPITSRTLSMKNGDLMVMYKLLPEIAVKAYDQIHSEHMS